MLQNNFPRLLLTQMPLELLGSNLSPFLKIGVINMSGK